MEEDKTQELQELLKQQEKLQSTKQEMTKLFADLNANKNTSIWKRSKPIRVLSYLILFMLLVMIATIIFFYSQLL
jgi:preprotein translocase subunit Sec63